MTDIAHAPKRLQLMAGNVVGREGAWRYQVLVGCMEVPSGSMPVETVLPFMLPRKADDGFDLHLGDPQDRPRQDGLLVASVDGIVREMRVAPPPGLGRMLDHGGLHLRRTRFPTMEGRETLVACGIVRAKTALTARVLHELSAHGTSFGHVGSRSVPGAFPTGALPSVTLKMPVWGFGPVPRGFRSTQHLDLMDDVATYARLMDAPDLSEDERRHRDRLARGEAGRIVRDRRTHTEFVKWIEAAKRLGLDIERVDTYPTPEESAKIARVSVAAFESVRENGRGSG